MKFSTGFFGKCLLAGVLTGCSFTASAAPTYLTGTYFGGTGDEDHTSVEFAPDGTIIVVGDSTSSGSISGKAPIVLGTEGTGATGYILRYSNDGRTLLGFTRFGKGIAEIDDVAVNSTGIYVLGFATSGLAPLISGLGGMDTTAPTSGRKPFIVKLSSDASTILEGTYLGGADSDRDIIGLDFMANGDIAVVHDNGSSDYLSRLSSDLSTQRWRVSFGTRAGSSRPQGLAASPADDKIYVVGYGMGNTCCEPLKGSYLFKFNGSNGVQEWTKSNGNKAIYNNSPREGDGRLNGLISDSSGQNVAVDAAGNPLYTGFSDGGATIHQKDPNDWTKSCPNLDGEGFWGFSGATVTSVHGRLDKSTHQWIRLNAFTVRDSSGDVHGSKINALTSIVNDRVLSVGFCPPPTRTVNAWYANDPSFFNGMIMKSKMDGAGTVREFITQVPKTRYFTACAQNGTGNRYAVVGISIWDGAPTPGGVQRNFGGGARDGFLVVMDDDAGGPVNVNPVVTITSPANGTTFNAPASIPIAASASDSDGTVSKVEFMAGSTLLGTDSTNPYGVTWANVATGSFSLSAKASDNAGATGSSSVVNVVVNGSGSPITGSLTGVKGTQPASLSLNSEGTRDWVHWGLNASTDFNHKSGVTSQISNITKIGTTTLNRYTDGTMANSWTGGTPTSSTSSTRAGVYVAGVNNGFQITVPADTNSRILRIYCGLWKSQGKLEAALSDGSAAPFVDTTHGSTTGSANTMFTLNYNAASAGQTLTVKWTVQTSHDTAGNGTVGWQAATLQ